MVNFKVCQICGFWNRHGARTMTGHRQCNNPSRLAGQFTGPKDTCEAYAGKNRFEGAVADLDGALTYLTLALGLLTGSNGGTVTDPRCPDYDWKGPKCVAGHYGVKTKRGHDWPTCTSDCVPF